MPTVRAHLHAKAVLHLVQLAVSLGLTIRLAMASFRFFETPFLRLKRYFVEDRRVAAGETTDARQLEVG